MAPRGSSIIPVEKIQKRIYVIRGLKILLDRDLAELYGVETRDLNKAVTRNLDRFPKDFMFQLNKGEFGNLKFHFGTSRWGGTRKLPRAFTEQGVAMLSSVLRSKRAIQVNIAIMRAFAKLREILADNVALRRKVEEHDVLIKRIFKLLKPMMQEPEKSREPFGFRSKKVGQKKFSTKSRRY